MANDFLINWDKNKWHALSKNGQWFFNQVGYLIKLNKKNDIYGQDDQWYCGQMGDLMLTNRPTR